MAATTTTAYDQRDPLDHLDASLQDFEPTMSPGRKQALAYPSAHSGFLRSDASSILSETTSDLEDLPDSPGGFSPPAWRRLENGDRDSGFWRRRFSDVQPPPVQLTNGRFGPTSRESSPEYDLGSSNDVTRRLPQEGEDVLDRAMRTRLPTGSMSPDKGRSPSPVLKGARGSHDPMKLNTVPWTDQLADASPSEQGTPDNYIRFQLRADVQHRTEPIEAVASFFRTNWQRATHSWSSIIVSTLVAVFSIFTFRNLTQPGIAAPVPDLVRVAGIARSFEPFIYFSEHAASHVGGIQATGVAVWDLSESVRASNMTSAALICNELDSLSDNFQTLAIELTRFFVTVDGDIDAILLVMEWAQRELAHVQNLPSPPLTSAFDNIHSLLSRAGVLETANGEPTALGVISTQLMGMSSPQRTRRTLQRTFNEFLGVLEEAIENELQQSIALFTLFESIERQFQNVARSVIREETAQDELHADLLSSLWTRILGANAGALAKFERNRQLLADLRANTVENKVVLVEHNGKLMSLKANLENVRRKLVSPLVRGVSSSALTVEDQIEGVMGVHKYLEEVRVQQKRKTMELLYGSGSAAGQKKPAIEGLRLS